MTLPTDGFTTTTVSYTLGTSTNLTVRVSVGTDTQSRRDAADEFLPYLEDALNGLRTAYQNGTTETVSYIDRAYSGAASDTL